MLPKISHILGFISSDHQFTVPPHTPYLPQPTLPTKRKPRARVGAKTPISRNRAVLKRGVVSQCTGFAQNTPKRVILKTTGVPKSSKQQVCDVCPHRTRFYCSTCGVHCAVCRKHSCISEHTKNGRALKRRRMRRAT